MKNHISTFDSMEYYLLPLRSDKKVQMHFSFVQINLIFRLQTFKSQLFLPEFQAPRKIESISKSNIEFIMVGEQWKCDSILMFSVLLSITFQLLKAFVFVSFSFLNQTNYEK